MVVLLNPTPWSVRPIEEQAHETGATESRTGIQIPRGFGRDSGHDTGGVGGTLCGASELDFRMDAAIDGRHA